MDLAEVLSSKEFQDFAASMLEQSKEAAQRKYELLNENAESGKAVMIGDSIVEQFPLCELLNERIYNRGISGDTSAELLKRLPFVTLPLRPSKVFIWIGTNDLAAGVDLSETVANVKKVCDTIKLSLSGTNINIISVAPVDVLSKDNRIRSNVDKRNNELIGKMNAAYKQLCEEYELQYIDVYSALEQNGSLNNLFTEDGLHLTVRGYLPVCERIEKYL